MNKRHLQGGRFQFGTFVVWVLDDIVSECIVLFGSITKIRVICTYVHRTSHTLRVGQKFAYRIHNGICFIF